MMPFSEQDIQNLQRKVEHYKEVLQNTKHYREIWKKELKKNIVGQLHALAELGGLTASIQELAASIEDTPNGTRKRNR